MIKSIAEILLEISKAPAEKRVPMFKYYESEPLKAVLFYALDPRAKWLLPEGAPPFRPLEALDQHGRLHQEARKLYMFLDAKLNLSRAKREQLFIQFLEMIDPEDAKLIIAAKDKKMPYPNITAELVNEAFPGLIKVEPKAEPVADVETKPKTKRKKKEEVSGAKA